MMQWCVHLFLGILSTSLVHSVIDTNAFMYYCNGEYCDTYFVVLAAPSPKVFDWSVRQTKNLIWLQGKCQHYLQ